MQIQIKDKSQNGEVYVKGLVGPHSIENQLREINEKIQEINRELRASI